MGIKEVYQSHIPTERDDMARSSNKCGWWSGGGLLPTIFRILVGTEESKWLMEVHVLAIYNFRICW